MKTCHHNKKMQRIKNVSTQQTVVKNKKKCVHLQWKEAKN